MEPLHLCNEGYDKGGKAYDLLDTAIQNHNHWIISPDG